MMQLDVLGEWFFPVAFSDVKLPQGLIHDDQIQNAEGLARLITQSKNHPAFGRLDSPYVVFSVPEAKSFVRVISVPKMTEQEALEAVPFEAEQYIPMSSDQVYLDFKILPPRQNAEADKMKVIICATPKTLVDAYVGVIKLAGLKPVAIEVESEAVARALVDKKFDSEPTLVLDMDTFHTSLIIYDFGTLQFTSSLPVAGNSLTSQIAQKLTVSADEAEKMKRQVGLLSAKDGGKARESLVPLLNSLVEAIVNTINFYREHSEGSREIRRILLCGGASKLRGLTEYLNQQINKNEIGKISRLVQLGDPWVNVLQKPFVKVPPISKNDSAGFATVVGLALRGANSE